MTTHNLTTEQIDKTPRHGFPNSRASARTWIEIRHSITGKLIAKYCPETHQLEAVDRRVRAVIDLPKPS